MLRNRGIHGEEWNTTEVLGSSEQLVVKDQQLERIERGARVRAAFMVAEFDLKNSGGQVLNYRPHLSANQIVRWDIFQQRDDIEKFWFHSVITSQHIAGGQSREVFSRENDPGASDHRLA